MVPAIKHANFNVGVGHTDAGYRVWAIDTPGGDGQAPFDLPFGATDLSQLQLALRAGAADARRVLPVEPVPAAPAASEAALDVARIAGQRLFEALFAGSVGDCLQRALVATQSRGERLRIRLRLDEAPELGDLPWEYLYDPDRRQFLCLWDRVSLVRYPSGAEPIEPLAVEPPLRVLIMVSQPPDVAELDVSAELQQLETALRSLSAARRVDLLRCPASLDALVPELRQVRPHVFHFIGHGAFATTGGSLLLEGSDGRARQVTGEELGALLVSQSSLRLVLLNACDSGRGSLTDAFAGVAQQLVRRGVPAVIGMRSGVSDDAAIAFTQQFYESVADGYPVDAAVTEGRKMMFARSRVAEWGTPVLYLRASDAQVFSIEPESESMRQKRAAAVFEIDARHASETERWPDAVHALEALVRLEPDNRDAAARLGEARRRDELGRLYEQGQEHLRHERWREALDCFNRVSDLAMGDPHYRGVYAHIATARTQLAPRSAVSPFNDSAASPPAAGSILEACSTMLRRLAEGRCVVILGGDVNCCGRPPGEHWAPGQAQYLPTATEVAEHLASSIDYPSNKSGGLVNVSQMYATFKGVAALREAVRSVLDVNYAPTALHRFLASLPSALRAKNYAVGCPLLVTTNYDDALERALEDAREEFDVLTYMPDDEERKAHFVHRAADGTLRHIEKANEYGQLALDMRSLVLARTLVLKVHGAIDRQNSDAEGFVLAEDDYIDYPSGSDIGNLLPPALVTKLRKNHLLFLGYSPSDWSLRVFFRRIWRERRPENFTDMAVASVSTRYDERFWRVRGVDVLPIELERFVAEMATQIDALPSIAGRV